MPKIHCAKLLRIPPLSLLLFLLLLGRHRSFLVVPYLLFFHLSTKANYLESVQTTSIDVDATPSGLVACRAKSYLEWAPRLLPQVLGINPGRLQTCERSNAKQFTFALRKSGRVTLPTFCHRWSSPSETLPDRCACHEICA